ncbi:hypothetical protein N9B65_07225 [Akkermansiaceae bacterium]|nr:hypothetical protein [Akkermansiaceae bacterium]
MFEHPRQLIFHYQGPGQFAKDTKADRVMDEILHQRPALRFLKGMTVVPKLKWTRNLIIHEAFALF